jgi:D-alanyl-D-alanine carboxypeptidase
LNDALAAVKKDRVLAKDATEKPAIPVENGKAETVAVAASDDIWAVARATDFPRVKVIWDVPQKLPAPVKAGTEVGEVRAELDGHVLGKAKVTLASDVQASTWVWRTEKMIRSYLGGSE